MYMAVKNGNVEKIKELVDLGHDVNDMHDYSSALGENTKLSPAVVAARHGHVDVINILAKLGADLRGKKSDVITPACEAAKFGQANVIKTLAALGIDVNEPNVEGFTPLYFAAERGDLAVVKALIDAEIDVENYGDDRMLNPLLIASYYGYTEVVKTLALCGSDVNSSTDDGVTPVFVAAQQGHVGTIKTLLEFGADVNKSMVDGTSPAYIGVQKGHMDVINFLAENGARMGASRETGDSLLHIAAFHGHVEMIRALHALGLDVNITECHGASPVYDAAQQGHEEAIKVLAELGCNINIARSDNGVSPIYAATQNGHASCVHALIKIGADVNACDVDGVTPIHIAAYSGSIEIAKILCSWNLTNVDVIASQELSAISLAVQHGHHNIVDLLLDIGGNLTPSFEPESNLHDMDMMEYLHAKVSTFCDNFGVDKEFQSATLTTYSLTKLLFRVAVDEQIPFVERHIAHSLLSLFQSNKTLMIFHISPPSFVVKRKVARIVLRLFRTTMKLVSDRWDEHLKSLNYVELVLFFLNKCMLEDVLALRFTCKSNMYRQRFPVTCGGMCQELEAHIIEEWLSYDACRFVSTDVICAVREISCLP